MSNYLVTGYTGEDVTAALDAHMHAALVGASSYVSTLGNRLAASAVDANTIRLAAGALFFQGLFACIPTGQYVDVAIESGTQGQNRNDLIGFRYTKNTTTGAESGEFVAIKGTPVTGTPSDPAYTDGDILGGDTAGFMPLYHIPISGITVGTPVALYTTVYPASEILKTQNDIDALTSSVRGLMYKPGDVLTVSRMEFASHITGTNGNNVLGFIPLSKTLVGVSAVTFSNPSGTSGTSMRIRHANGGYLFDETISVAQELGTLTLTPVDNGMIFSFAVSSGLIPSESAAPNNAPVSVEFLNLKITFS